MAWEATCICSLALRRSRWTITRVNPIIIPGFLVGMVRNDTLIDNLLGSLRYGSYKAFSPSRIWRRSRWLWTSQCNPLIITASYIKLDSSLPSLSLSVPEWLLAVDIGHRGGAYVYELPPGEVDGRRSIAAGLEEELHFGHGGLGIRKECWKMAKSGKCKVCKTIYPNNIDRDSNKGALLGISPEKQVFICCGPYTREYRD